MRPLLFVDQSNHANTIKANPMTANSNLAMKAITVMAAKITQSIFLIISVTSHVLVTICCVFFAKQLTKLLLRSIIYARVQIILKGWFAYERKTT